MEKQDYLKRQIDQLGKALAKVFSILSGSKNNGQISAALDFTNQTFEKELGMEIPDLLDIPTDEFIDTLISQKKLTKDNLNQLAEIFHLLTEIQSENKKRLSEKSLTIFEYLEKVEHVYSFERQRKIMQLKGNL